MTDEQVATQTDYLVTRRLMAQVRRSEAQDRHMKKLPPISDEPTDGIVVDDAPPSRASAVLWLMSMGISKADAEREYDIMLANHTSGRDEGGK